MISYRARVAFVIDSLGVGGAEQSLAELIPALASEGIDPVVVYFHERRPDVKLLLQRAGVRMHRVPARTWIGRMHAVRQLVRREAIDVAYVTLFEANLVARFGLALSGTPVITALVSDAEAVLRLGPGAPWKKRTAVAIDRTSGALLTAHFHAVTEEVARSASRVLRVPSHRVTVIERGRSRGRLGRWSSTRRETVRRDLGIDPLARVAIHVGREEPAKGHAVLLTAWPGVQRRIPNALLLVVGRTGVATPEVEQILASLPVSARDSIVRLGHRDDVPDLLACSDLFVMPSLWEGAAGAAIEALAMRLPVVASDLPSLRGFLVPSVNALLVRPNDAPALADAAISLLADIERGNAMGLENERLFDQRFTIEASASKVARMLWAVARSGRDA